MARAKQTKIGKYSYYRRQVTMPNGKKKSLYGKTAKEADEKARKLQLDLSQRHNPLNITVKEYTLLQLDLMKPNIRNNTFVGYEAKARRYIIEPLGHMRLDDVTQDDIRKALVAVAPLSVSSYRTVHMLLRRIFSSAKNNKLIADDPTVGVSGRGGKQMQPKEALSDTEEKCLLAAIAGLPVETYIRVGLGTGCRREEILALQWDGVHLDTEYPYIDVCRAWHAEHNRPVISTDLKTKAAYRKIPITPELATFLQVLKATAKSDYVVCNRDGDPLSETQWRNLWNTVTRRSAGERTYTRYANGTKTVHTVRAELGRSAVNNPNVTYNMGFAVTSHQLRHTYITNLIYAGVDPKTVQYLAGHENIEITMRIYAKVKYNRPEDLAPIVLAAFRRIAEGVPAVALEAEDFNAS